MDDLGRDLSDALERAERESKRNRFLSDLGSSVEFEELLDRVLDAALEVPGLRRRDGRARRSRRHVDDRDARDDGRRRRRTRRPPAPPDRSPPGRSRSATATAPSDAADTHLIRGGLFLSLVSREGHALGSLALFWRSPGYEPSPERIAAIEQIAATSIPAIENARRYREARQLAETDALTGFFNQRYFHETLRRESLRAQRYDRRLALLIIDLDDFKAVNDRIGHLAGDAVLAQVAERLRNEIRSVDIGCRVGGDEFGGDHARVDRRGRVAALPADARRRGGDARARRDSACASPPGSPSSVTARPRPGSSSARTRRSTARRSSARTARTSRATDAAASGPEGDEPERPRRSRDTACALERDADAAAGLHALRERDHAGGPVERRRPASAPPSPAARARPGRSSPSGARPSPSSVSTARPPSSTTSTMRPTLFRERIALGVESARTASDHSTAGPVVASGVERASRDDRPGAEPDRRDARRDRERGERRPARLRRGRPSSEAARGSGVVDAWPARRRVLDGVGRQRSAGTSSTARPHWPANPRIVPRPPTATRAPAGSVREPRCPATPLCRVSSMEGRGSAAGAGEA